MNANKKDIDRDLRVERYITASLLILGFLLLIPGVQLFVVGQKNLSIPNWARSIDTHVWERNLLSAGVVVTLLGLVMLEDLLRRAGDAILSRLGLVGFMLGTVMWLTVNALSLDGRGWIAALETYFILFAFLASAFYSGAILRTSFLPRWVAIVALVWSVGVLIFVLPGNRGPLFYEPALLLIAIALLLKRVRVPVGGIAARGAR